MAKIDEVFENKCNLGQTSLLRGLVTPSTPENNIVWNEGGMREILQELQAEVYDLRTLLTEIQSRGLRQDIIAAPDVDASTFYETASDGALRAGVDVVVEGDGLVEVAMLEAPTIYYADNDTYINEYAPTTNYDTTNLRIGLTSGSLQLQSLIGFPWGTYNPGTEISGLWAAEPILALIKLTKDNNLDYEMNVEIYPIDKYASAWDEATVTWATRPAMEETPLDKIHNVDVDTVHYWDVAPYIKRIRETRDGSWTGTPRGFYLKAGATAAANDRVTFYDKETGTTEQDPQMLVWEKAYKSQVLGSATKEAKFYGKAGAIYYITYRYIDGNNNPGKWSIPVQVTLPSQGDTPSAPASAPTIQATNFSNVKTIILPTTRPVDFDCYEVDVNYTTVHEIFRTTSNRFDYTFESGSSGRTYHVAYRYITRSGKGSAWSDWSSFFTINNELKLQRAEFADGQANILIDSNGDIHLKHTSGSSSRTYDYNESQAWLILQNHIRSVSLNNLQRLYLTAANIGTSTIYTTSTSYVTAVSRTFTPDGAGTATMLILAQVSVFKNAGSGVHLTLRIDSTDFAAELGYSAAATAETLMFYAVVNVSAGSEHTAYLRWRSANGGSVAMYWGMIHILDLGRA